MKSINIITLGCSKNLVDSEIILNNLEGNGYTIYHDENKTADIVIINTCGFINDAKQESIDMILHFAELKKQNKIKELIVTGCLSQRYREELQESMPEVDVFWGVYDHQQLIQHITKKTRDVKPRSHLTTNHYAYLKISEGCSRHCSFCAIPMIKGKHHSYPMDNIINEARILAENGVKELILIAQDLTYYGKDLYGQPMLPKLIQKLTKIKNIQWIRLHYLFPANFPMELLYVIRNEPKVCKYIDIPFQHVSDHMLTMMNRGTTKDKSIQLLHTIQKILPEAATRTTLLVGHPGETEEDFNQLYEFVQSAKFDKLGVFVYSHEEGTIAGEQYTDNVPNPVKEERKEKIMALQQDISLALNRKKVNHSYTVLIDRHEDTRAIGRTQYDSPEVDGEVLIEDPGHQLIPGNFYNVKMVNADEYDVYGEIT